LAQPGDRQYLPRAFRVQAGFARADVLAWLAVRGQLGELVAGRGTRRRVGSGSQAPADSRPASAAGGA
jgi:hypothetical protein